MTDYEKAVEIGEKDYFCGDKENCDSWFVDCLECMKFKAAAEMAAWKGEQVDRLKCCANCVHHYRGVSTFVACCCNVHGNLHQFEDRCDKWEGGEE